MFKAIKDTNTGFVYDWVKKTEDGTLISVNIPRSNWKREQDWTTEEIDALFSVDTKKQTPSPKKPIAPVKVKEQVTAVTNSAEDFSTDPISDN
jgi:hypothetical protein